MAGTISNVVTQRVALTPTQNPLTITSTGAVEPGVGTAIYGQNTQSWTVTNAGIVIGGTNSTSIGIDLEAGGSIGNSGTIRGSAYGVRIAHHTGTVANSGSISGVATGIGLLAGGTVFNTGLISGGTVGVSVAGGAGTVIDAGTISSAGPGGAVKFAGTYSDRLILDAGAVLDGGVTGGAGTNVLELAPGPTAGVIGTLSGFGADITGFQTILVDEGADWLVNSTDRISVSLVDSGTLANTGTIATDVTLANGGSLDNIGSIVSSADGFKAIVDYTDAAIVTNSGTVQGKLASPFGFGVFLAKGGLLTNTATGLIAGGAYGVALAGAGGTIVNAGTIRTTGFAGNGVLLQSGNETLVNSGTVGGADQSVYLQFGGAVYNSGLIGADTIRYNAAQHAYVLQPTNAAYGIEVGGGRYSGGAASITNAGTISGSIDAIRFSGTTGFAGRVIADPGAVFSGTVAGGTLSGSTNALELAAGTAGATGTLSGFGTQFTGFGTLQIDSGANWVVGGTESGSAVQLAGTAAQRFVLQPGATFSGTVDATSAGSILELAPGPTAGVIGTLSGFGVGITGFQTILVDVGADWLVNSTDRISVSLVDSGTLINTGTISTDVTLANGGSLDNIGSIVSSADGFKAIVDYTDAATVTNSGTVQGKLASPFGFGVFLAKGGLLSNTATGLIAGGAYGVALAGAGGTIVNAGTIRTTGFAGNGVLLQSGNETLVNSGTIGGADQSVYLQFGGAVYNSGLIGADTIRYNAGQHAYVLQPTNAAYGIEVGGSGFSGGAATITNAGTISGSIDAIRFSGTTGFAGRVIADPGAVFSGTVAGGTLSGSTNVLELAAGTAGATGTLTGFGTQFTGFGTLQIDSGANWVVDSTVSNAGGVTLSVAGTLKNIGTIGATATLMPTGVIDNHGLITGGTNFGVLAIGGVVINETGATISGSASAVKSAGPHLTVDNSGVITGSADGVAMYAAGAVTNTAGTIVGTSTDGVLITGGAGTVINAGTIEGGIDAVQFNGNFSDRVVVDPGAVFIGAVQGGGGHNALELAAGTAGATGTLTGFGTQFRNFTTIDEDSGASWQVGGTFAAADGVTMIGAADTLTIENFASFAASISGFGTTDLISLAGVIANQATLVGSKLELFDGASEIGTLDIIGAFAHERFIATPNGTDGSFVDVVPCFLRGTQVLTDAGERAVESLRIGDLVTTLTGASRPIKWIGRRSYAGWLAAGNPKVLPIRFKAGALADHVPSRDLFVSPEHAMYLDGALVPAGLLVNGSSITRVEAMAAVEYFHVELDSQDVIFAEGAPAETFVDDDSRGMFQNAFEFHQLYPNAVEGPPRFYAPRIEDGFALEAVRRRLAERARRLRADGIAEMQRLDGGIDHISRDRIAGWARDVAGPVTRAPGVAISAAPRNDSASGSIVHRA